VLPSFSLIQWCVAVLAAVGIGVSKAGLPGISMGPVVIFALLFGARDSTGVVLPMLIMGDLFAVTAFRRLARWDYVRRVLPPACLGVVAGAAFMAHVTSNAAFGPVIGGVILLLACLQGVRMLRPAWFGDAPHSHVFAWAIGLAAGATTMLANASGPIMAVYLMAVALPKWEFVGTTAWFFVFINLFKLPFSFGLGLIHGHTLLFNLVLAPAVGAGLLAGRWLVTHVSQKTFDGLILVLIVLAALRLVGVL
jgi:hypothetical protein